MADWEQPSNSLLRKTPDNGGLEDQVESLKHQLQTANQRIAALERRLNHLESSALSKKGYVAGV
jgi:predicted  nucleic acid-binding Zn-ribbon protein